MLRQFNRLAAVERVIAASDNDRRALVRARISKKIVTCIESILDQWIGVVPPRTATGIALGYLRSEWEGLQAFLRDERVPIDNNCVENAIRPLALGRKNWLFAATTNGADASANLYSLLQTARANNIEPQAYLAQVFAEMPNAVTVDDVAKLLPYPTHFATDQAGGSRAYARVRGRSSPRSAESVVSVRIGVQVGMAERLPLAEAALGTKSLNA